MIAWLFETTIGRSINFGFSDITLIISESSKVLWLLAAGVDRVALERIFNSSLGFS